MDLYTKVMWTLIRRKLEVLPPAQDSSVIPVPTDAAKDAPVATLAPLLPLLASPPPLYYSLDTSDDHTAGPLVKRVLRSFVALLNALTPVRDATDAWPSLADADRMFAADFARYLPTATPWDDPTGDAALIVLATQGLGAHRLEHMDGDIYALDLRFLRDYAVRPGFEPYGGRLRLRLAGGQWRIEAIDLGDRECIPEDEDWWLSKLIVRSSLVAYVTIIDHALDAHVMTSGPHLIAASRSLPADHPIRRLLAPFHFNTGTVDLAAVELLLQEKRLFHRMFAFTWEAQNQLYARGIREYRSDTFPEDLDRRGMTGLGAAYPFGEDGTLLWDALEKQVSAYVELYYASDDAVANDRSIKAWADDLVMVLPAGAEPIGTRAALVRRCMTMMWNASVRHKQAGTVAPYLASASFVPAHVRKGKTLEACIPSPDHRALGLVLAAFTSPSYPKILGDFSQMALDQRGQTFWKAWKDTMQGLHETIDARNAGRSRPLHTFDPAHLECSVSI
jgi:hypothetical protein